MSDMILRLAGVLGRLDEMEKKVSVAFHCLQKFFRL